MSGWPAPLRPLCLRHGCRAVWLAGLTVLGYPGLWADSGSELLALRNALGE